MSADYAPGTVAVATARGVPNVRVMRCGGEGLATSWWSARYVPGGHIHPDRDVADVRPLVVLDPEDREQVERLRAMISDLVSSDQLVEALEHFLSPKPPEPTGLGAVVEDTEGIRWTRVESGVQAYSRNPWYPANCEDQPVEWSDIAAVKVLSDGVQP